MILLAPILIIVFVSLVRLYTRSFLAAWYSILIVSALDVTLGSSSALLGSLHLSPSDAVFACLLVAGAIRSRIWEIRFNPLSLMVLCYIGLFILSAARGLVLFDVTTVGNEGRGLIGEVVALLYFITVPHDRETIHKVVRAQILCSAYLVLVVLLHYAGLPVGGAFGAQTYLANQIDRGLPVTAVASIELSAVLATFWWIYEERGSRWIGLATSVFIIFAIGLQHRTVWAMLAVSIATTFFIDRRVMRVLLKSVAWAALAGLLLLSISSSLRARLIDDFEQSATNGGTFGWRVESWERSIDQDGGIFNILIGQPIGSGYTRLDIDLGTYTEYQPHNEFVNQYLRVGILGTLLLIVILARPLWLYLRGEGDDTVMFPGAAAWVTVTAAVITFGIPYSYVAEIIALSAMANGLTSGEFALAQESNYDMSSGDTESEEQLLECTS